MPGKRTMPLRLERTRIPMTTRSLAMMVLSGVVRRADLDPPFLATRTVYPVTDDHRKSFQQESASGQGWLSRMFLGRKHPHPAPDGGDMNKGYGR